MTYYDALVGTHLGVFPSWYEPWGYTPLESAILGVPTITTDLSGFGQYVKSNPLYNEMGVTVLSRRGVSDDAFVEKLTESFASFVALETAERVTRGFMAKRIAESCDWSGFIQNYVRAHDHALAIRRS
jgi:glycosyltransferase involved in cell wall biosynthesis